MRNLMYATTALVLCTGVAMAQTVTPDHGSVTDTAGNVRTIDHYGNVMQGSTRVPGGGNTAELTIVNGTIYGRDDGHGLIKPGGWFTLNGNQGWLPSSAPIDTTVGIGQPGSVQPTTVGEPSTASGPLITCAAAPGGSTGKGFHVQGGQIIAPDGSVFVAKGINVQSNADWPDAKTLKAKFPGINFVRFAVYDYADATPERLSSYVSDLTAAVIVVELEDHSNMVGNNGGGQGPAYTGDRLNAELEWYRDIAAAFKNNPSVWFGTRNEPPAGGLGAEQSATYAAIRATGNTAPILLEKWGGGYPGRMNEGLDPGSIAKMTNAAWDMHGYGWLFKMTSLDKAVAEAQQIKSADGVMPVLIGEYGITTSGTGVDDNAEDVLKAVHGSGLGSAAWVWDYGAANALTNGGNGLTDYGRTISGYIQLVANAPASIWATNCSAASKTVVAQAGNAAPNGDQPAASSADTSGLDAQAATQRAAAQAAIAAADAQASANAAAVQQANVAGAQADAILAGVLATVRGGK